MEVSLPMFRAGSQVVGIGRLPRAIGELLELVRRVR
jgi:hypothetical protein